MKAYQLLKNEMDESLLPDVSINSGVAGNLLLADVYNKKYIWITKKIFFYKFNYPFLNNVETYRFTSSGFKRFMKTGAESVFDTGLPYLSNDFVFPIRFRTRRIAVFNYGGKDR